MLDIHLDQQNTSPPLTSNVDQQEFVVAFDNSPWKGSSMIEVVSTFKHISRQVELTTRKFPTSSYSLRESKIAPEIQWRMAQQYTIYLYRPKQFFQ